MAMPPPHKPGAEPLAERGWLKSCRFYDVTLGSYRGALKIPFPLLGGDELAEPWSRLRHRGGARVNVHHPHAARRSLPRALLRSFGGAAGVPARAWTVVIPGGTLVVCALVVLCILRGASLAAAH